jgi:hypothetical protein
MVAHGGGSGLANPNRVGERLIAVEIEKAEQDRRRAFGAARGKYAFRD